MKISYYGHSCFLIESEGYKIVLDPYNEVEGRKMPELTADEACCSHDHFDHNYVEGLKLSGPAKEKPFKITEIHSFHDEVKGAKRGKNIIRIFEAEGYRIAHFGDIGCELEEDQLRLLEGLDIALIPVGGTYTINHIEAKALIERIKPVTTIPMHYRDGKKGFAVISDIREFTGLFEQVSFAAGTLSVENKPEGIAVMESLE